MDKMEMMTQAKKTEASLFTYLTPTKTSKAMKRRKMEPYILMLFNMAAPSPSKIAALGAMYICQREREREESKKQASLI